MQITRYLPTQCSKRTWALCMVVLGIVSCGPPDYGDTPFLCGSKGECPQDYQCLDKVCVRNGFQPSQTGTTNQSNNTTNGGSAAEGPGAAPPSTYVDTTGANGQPAGGVNSIPPSFGNQNTGGFGGDQGGPWGAPCFFPADCPANQRCGFFTGRCCDPLANPSCV